ncbi:hypothetical protein [Streptomyces sp. NPDC059389]|uniref:D-alanyl-D-alanine carboxypeptidase n=1 Tax=Streptomyces sp. NPDC059389 TaxID=3346818 RepID=UPI0036923C4A
MVAIEEELVAGESPDKSVDEGAPGAAMSSAERDPRLSVFRPREPESGTSAAASGEDRDPLRDAVAAWVATTEDETGTEAESGTEVETEPEAAAEAEPEGEAGAGSSGRVDAAADSAKAGTGAPAPDSAKAGTDAPAEAPVAAPAEDPAKAPAKAPAVAPEPDPAPAVAEGGADAAAEAAPEPSAHDSERTAVFRAVRPESRTDAPAPAPAKSADAERTPAADSDSAPSDTSTAVSATAQAAADAPSGKPAPASGGKPSGAARPDSGSASATDRPTAAETAAKPSAENSERTAVFRTVKPGTTPAAKSADSGSASGPERPAAAKPSADDSERTAVFRTVKPGSVPAGKPADPAAKPADSGSASAPEKPAPAKPSADDSERTAVFRAPKVDSAAGGAGKGSDEAADSERTAVFRAVKPDAKASAPAAEKPVASRPVPPKAVGGERASTFVPLRKDDAPAPAPAKPAPAAAGSAPAPAKPAATTPAPVPVPERSERTTQQPLPPKPPLDMLADLTNNPPPPPSPIRTAVRRFKIYAPLVALLAIILAVVQLVRPMPEPKLTMTAKSSYTFDGGNPVLPWPKEGQAYMAAAGLGTVGSFGEQKPVAIGSVAKTMTAYVILKNHPLKKGEKGPLIDIDKTAVDDGAKSSEGESTVGTLKAGDKINEYDALAAIMIPSANNVARLLARWDSGGDQEAFVKKMNDAAKELGMTNTTYTDPSGLDATTVSTAEDQVKLGLKVVEMPELVAITKLPEWTDQYGKKWRNYNTLIPGNGALGIKTGSTTKAGGNLLFAAEKQVGNTKQLIVGAVLGQYGVPILDTAIAASKQVMLATQKMLVNAPVVKKGDVVGYVDDGLGGHTPVVATADVEAVGWPSLTVNLKLAAGDGKLPQTAKAGTEIGVLTVGEGASQVKVPVALQSDLAAPGIGSKLTRVG